MTGRMKRISHGCSYEPDVFILFKSHIPTVMRKSCIVSCSPLLQSAVCTYVAYYAAPLAYANHLHDCLYLYQNQTTADEDITSVPL